MGKSNVQTELERLADTTLVDSEARKNLFSKIAASGMDRKTVNKEIAMAQKAFAKARKEFEEASSQLKGLQDRVEKATELMNSAKMNMIGLNQAAQTMDLTGADALRPEKDGLFSYILGGNRMFADVSDASDPKLVPFKEIQGLSDEERAEKIKELLDINKASDEETLEEESNSEELEGEAHQVFDFDQFLTPEDEGEVDDEFAPAMEEVNYPESLDDFETPEDYFSNFEDVKDVEDVENVEDEPDALDASDFAWREASIESKVITKIAKKKFR